MAINNSNFKVKNGTEIGGFASIGNAGTPDRPLVISTANNPLAAGQVSVLIQGDVNKERLGIRSSAAPVVFISTSRGTVSAPTAVQTGDGLGTFQLGGYDGADWVRSSWTSAFAAENWTTTARGADIVFSTTPIGSTVITERLRIGAGGQLGIGGANYGTAGQVLTSGGPSAPPTWSSSASGGTLSSVTAAGNTTSTMMISTNSTIQSLTDGAMWFNQAGGAILFDDNAHKRISWNDGGGNFNIRSGNYQSSTGTLYAKGAADANGGAATLSFATDGADGSIFLGAAAIGVPGATVSYVNTLTIHSTLGSYFAGNVGIGGAPNTKLHLTGSSQTLRIQDSGANGTTLDILVNNTEIRLQGTATTAATAYMSLWTANLERMRIDLNGLIGFGGTPVTSQGHLQVFDTVAGGAATSARFVNGSGTANSAVLLSLDPGGNGISVRDSQIRASNDGGNNTNLTFWTSAAAAPVQRMLVDTNGIYTPHYVRSGAQNAAALAWGTTNGTLTGAFNAYMGTGAGASWLISGTSNGTFRCGIQALDSTGEMRIYNNGSYVTVNGNNITLTGNLNSSDIHTSRTGAATTGYVYYGNTGTKYAGFDGTNFVSSMPMYFNILGSSTSCTGNAATATSATNVTGTAGTLGYSTASADIGYNGAGGPQVMGSTTNAAMLSFHRAGAYAVNFGLDTDNILKVGGWSNGAGVKNVILHSGNYTSYSPTLTGSGASGTWSINVTGSATYATYQSMNFGTTSNWNTHFTETGSAQRSWCESSVGGPSGTWWFIENMRHSNSGSYWGRQNAWGWEDNATELYSRNVQAGTWGSWVRFVHSGNYASIIPTAASRVNVVTLTAAGTYTKPANLKYAVVEMVGGGGGGGYARSSSTTITTGGGGGAGGYLKFTLNASSFSSIGITSIGARGIGGYSDISQAATAGGNTTITLNGYTINAYGGQPGVSGAANAGSMPGGPGGTTTVESTVAAAGGIGITRIWNNGGGRSGGSSGGIGDSTFLGKGGQGGLQAYILPAIDMDYDGWDASGYGAGGGGGRDYTNNTMGFGGHGSYGVVIITEYLS